MMLCDIFNPILHTWFRDSCFICEVLFQMGEGYAAIHWGGGLPVVGGGGQSDDS